MSHLSISRKVSFNRLVEIASKYMNELSASNDVFERAELNGYLDDICQFCYLNRGHDYWLRVLNAAKQKE